MKALTSMFTAIFIIYSRCAYQLYK